MRVLCWSLLLVGLSICMGVRGARLSDPSRGPVASSRRLTTAATSLPTNSTFSSSHAINDAPSTTMVPSPPSDNPSGQQEKRSSIDTVRHGSQSHLPPNLRGRNPEADQHDHLVNIVQGITGSGPLDEDDSLTSIFARALQGSTEEYDGASRVLAALAGHRGPTSQDDHDPGQKAQRGQSEALRALQDAVQASRTDTPDVLAAKVSKARQWLSDAIALDKSMNGEHGYMDETQRSLLDQAEHVLQRLERKRAHRSAKTVHEDL